MDIIESKITETLKRTTDALVQNNIRNNDTKWTRDIKTALIELAYETFDYRVYASKANDWDHTTNECLYDMIWYESLEGHPNDLNLIHLALECEWKISPLEINYDFYKLIQVRAEHRVMIFQSKDVSSTVKDLIDIIKKSRISLIGDRYLLAGWDLYNDGFTFELVIKNT